MDHPKDPQALIDAMTAYMAQYMADYDPSHNKAHVDRVVALAQRILAGELTRHPDTAPDMYDQRVVILAATLHDVGDHKYLLTADNNSNNNNNNNIDPKQIVYNALLAHGADEKLAERVQTIVSNVSYSNEIKHPEKVRALIAQPGYHELAIVQDADRIDAIGSVGIARTFTYLGAQGGKKKKKKEAEDPSSSWELDDSIAHFEEKLEKLYGMMKTDTGREIARVRHDRLGIFKAWWKEETTP